MAARRRCGGPSSGADKTFGRPVRRWAPVLSTDSPLVMRGLAWGRGGQPPSPPWLQTRTSGIGVHVVRAAREPGHASGSGSTSSRRWEVGWGRSPGWPAPSPTAEVWRRAYLRHSAFSDITKWSFVDGSAPIDGLDCSPRHGFVKDPKQDRNIRPTSMKLRRACLDHLSRRSARLRRRP